jgi:hypothetical protein
MVGVAQLAEHWVVAPGVEGSNPFTHPLFGFFVAACPRLRGHTPPVPGVKCAPGWDSGNRGPLAQLVEQLTLNQRVRSSNLRRPIVYVR